MPIAPIFPFQSSSTTKSIADRATEFFASIQSKFEGRNAVRYKFKVRPDLGHKFEEIVLKEPTLCSQCSKLIWGFVGQSCELCKLSSHKRCLDRINFCCIVSSINKQEFSHNLKVTTFWKPTYCDHCGTMISGIYNQGLKCSCGLELHHECERLVNWPCKNRQVDQHEQQQRHKQQHQDECTSTWGKICINDFDLISVLGSGSYGKVYLARLKSSQKEFAIKVVKKTNSMVGADPESVFTEKKVLSFGRQFNFLPVNHCCFQSELRLYYVMDHVVGRDLLYHIRKARKFTETRARFHSAEIALALSFLHKQGVIYRDLKLENVILDEHGHCVLLDFGFSKDLNKTESKKTRTFCGTLSYISPEMILEQDYDFSTDWWSYGVLMFEMLVGYSPFEFRSEDRLYKSIVEEEVEVPKFLSPRATSILEGLLTKDPNKRLGCQISKDRAREIFEHAFFEDQRWEDIMEKRIKPPYIPSPEDLEKSLEGNKGNNEISLTPICDQSEVITQSEFEGFSYYSPSFIDNFKIITKHSCGT